MRDTRLRAGRKGVGSAGIFSAEVAEILNQKNEFLGLVFCDSLESLHYSHSG